MCDGVRRHLAASGEVEPPTTLADRELIERHVARVIVKPQALEVCLIPACEASAQAEDPIVDEPASCRPPMTTITLAWTAPSFAAVKGIIHAPCAKPTMKPESRDALLTAIAKARRWIDEGKSSNARRSTRRVPVHPFSGSLKKHSRRLPERIASVTPSPSRSTSLTSGSSRLKLGATA